MSHRNSTNHLTSIVRAIRHQNTLTERSINPVLIVLAIAFSLIFLAGLAITIGGATYAFNRYSEIAKGVVPPEQLIATLPQGGARIYDRNGNLMYEFVDEFTGLRRPVQLENISHWLIEATLAVEDPTFYENNGLNTKGLVRATIENLTPYGGDFLEGSGGSSITQQLAKNVYIPLEERSKRTIDRKSRETVIAIELTEQYTKEEILGWYLNSISYGGIYTGIEAAAQGYFNKTASELTIAEAALLAGIPQSPGLYYPFHHIDLQTSQLIPGSPPIVRQHQVLNLMAKRGLISEIQANNAKTTPLEFKANRFEIEAPHFVLGRIADEITARFGEGSLVRAGLEVVTTIDLNLQHEAEKLLEVELAKIEEKTNTSNGALVSIDVNSGQILTYIGSRDYFRDDIEGRNDNAIAPNSPGSTLKPFTYMTAFMKGWGTGTAILDTPLILIDPATSEEYEPRNPVREFQGPMTVAHALGNSMNIPAIKAMKYAGIEDTIRVMKQVGHTALDNPAGYGPSLTVGGGEITLFDQAISYSVLAANGVMKGQENIAQKVDPGERKLEPIAILRVRDSNGNVLHEFDRPETRRIVSSDFTSLVTSILSDGENQCLTYYTCNWLGLPNGRPSATKTGTSEPFEDSKDIGETWTIGYTPKLVTAVWLGNADNSPLRNISSQGPSTTIWKTYMTYASNYLGYGATPFLNDPRVVTREVCWPSGKLPTEHCPQMNRYQSSYSSAILPQSIGELANFEDDWWKVLDIDTRTGLRATNRTPASFISKELRLDLPTEDIKDWEDIEDWAVKYGIGNLLAPPVDDPENKLPVEIVNLRPYEKIKGLYELYGRAESADFKNFSLEWGLGTEPTTWFELLSSDVPVSSEGLLGVWETRNLSDGIYTIRIVMQDKKFGIRQYQVPIKIENGTESNQHFSTPIVRIDSPIDGSLLKGDVLIKGVTLSPTRESVVVQIGESLNPTTWDEIIRDHTQVAGDEIGKWQTDEFSNGIYTIQVILTDRLLGKAKTSIYVVVQN